MTESPTPEDLEPDFVMVPREPSEEMLRAGAREGVPDPSGGFYFPNRADELAPAYRAMIAAAPPTPSTEALRVEIERLRAGVKDALVVIEDGENHDVGAFDEDCPICAVANRLRALLPNGGSDEG